MGSLQKNSGGAKNYTSKAREINYIIYLQGSMKLSIFSFRNERQDTNFMLENAAPALFLEILYIKKNNDQRRTFFN